jgi:primosomal protein N' (replication factor Y) (superfamily II helicase)
MDFFDIIFPVNIHPLTYACPESLTGSLKSGMIVSASLKGRITKGIVFGKSLIKPPGNIKSILAVHGDKPLLNDSLLNLLKWMSAYYIAEQGLVLKNMLPRDAFENVKVRNSPGEDQSKGLLPDNARGNDGVADKLIKSLNNNIYNTFLLHAPSSSYEYLLLIRTLARTTHAIILVPEISMIESIYPLLHDTFGERVCLFHSDLSRGKRSEAWGRIVSERSDIVLGTRSAVFAPMKKLSFIAVLHEHNTSFKQEKSPCYHARDVAVMRGFMGKTTVLLSSISPSLESFYNCMSGKYTLLKPSDDIKRAKIRILNMRHEKLFNQHLSKTVVDAAATYTKMNKKILFFMNRRGYSTCLQCDDCEYIEECPRCSIPLIFHKNDMAMKCHYCAYTLPKIPDSCHRCKGCNLRLRGAGTQKVQEDLERLIGMKTFRIDSDTARKKRDIKQLIGLVSSGESRIIIGTKLMTRRLTVANGFSMAAVLNADLFLNIPDFRSTERAYQEISSIADTVEPGGEIFIQTRMPQNFLFKNLKKYAYASFVKEELPVRRELNYPPYAKLLLIKFITGRDLSKKLSEVRSRIGKGVEVLGPFTSKESRDRKEFRLLLKSSLRGSLHEAARMFLEAFRNDKDTRIRVDVDPVMI